MIGRGRYNDVYLYEVTEQDLLLGEDVAKTYRVGNVLMFMDKRAIDLGAELARAEDLAAAKEYLTQGEWHPAQGEWQNSRPDYPLQAQTSQEPLQAQTDNLASRIASQEESLRELTEKIEQRDELLRDLSESLKAQKRDNEFLHEQLEQARAQLAVDEIRHNELVDDLQHVSEETFTIETTLERVIDEKFRLEQELAERITELVEMSLQNDDLKRQLVEPECLGAAAAAGAATATAGVNASAGAGATVGTTGGVAMNDEALSLGAFGTDEDLSVGGDSRVLTMSSGKKIHVLHEFPTAPKPTLVSRVSHAFTAIVRVAVIILFATLVLAATSIFATAHVNDISYGAALDLVMQSLNLLS
ncbi:MAG: hypothetical protein LBH56_03970 [Coriobacteriales bacterium]|jgi:hypothetical protein|nr:hypothetical protein [Coriobacteriales bacterium]